MSDEFDDKTPMDSENEELNENQESASEEIVVFKFIVDNGCKCVYISVIPQQLDVAA